MTTARHLSSLTIKTKSCLYSQWFSGGDNVVPDALSRDFQQSSHDRKLLLTSSVLEQVPFGLEIQHLPNEISYWLSFLLQNQPSIKQWSKEPMGSKLALELDTRTTSSLLDVNMISSMNHLRPTSPHSRSIQSSRNQRRVIQQSVSYKTQIRISPCHLGLCGTGL